MSDHETMTIDLPRAMADGLRRAVADGEFSSHSHAIQAALRAWQETHGVEDFSADHLRGLVEEAITSGPSSIGSINDLKREARRRWDSRSV